METSCKNLVQEKQGMIRDLLIEDDSVVIMSTPVPALHILELPESIILHIFGYLPFGSMGSVSQVCTLWNRISCDELLWRDVFLQHYKLPVTITLPAKARSWQSEFKRLFYHTPAVLVEERKEHKDEVLHVSFSHDGTMFATCSKDGFFKVWECTHPVRLLFKMDMKSSFSWKFTQFSQFNETDTCLLVSGVYFGRLSTSGEIAVFNLQDDFRMQCRVTNKPYDVFGAWYDNDHLLSGTLYWTGDFNSVSAVWLSKASQEVESEVESVSMVLYRFENVNSSSIRLLHVAEVDKDADVTESYADKDDQEMSESAITSPRSSSLGLEDYAKSITDLEAVSTARGREESKIKGQGCSQQTESQQERICILDQLLRKCISEDEFDLENEDKTDDDDNDEGGENDFQETNVLGNEMYTFHEDTTVVNCYQGNTSSTSNMKKEDNGWEPDKNQNSTGDLAFASGVPSSTNISYTQPNPTNRTFDSSVRNKDVNMGLLGGSGHVTVDRTWKRKSTESDKYTSRDRSSTGQLPMLCECDSLSQSQAHLCLSDSDRTQAGKTCCTVPFNDEALSIPDSLGFAQMQHTLSSDTSKLHPFNSLSVPSFSIERDLKPVLPQASYSSEPKVRVTTAPPLHSFHSTDSDWPSKLALLDFLAGATGTSSVSGSRSVNIPSVENVEPLSQMYQGERIVSNNISATNEFVAAMAVNDGTLSHDVDSSNLDFETIQQRRAEIMAEDLELLVDDTSERDLQLMQSGTKFGGNDAASSHEGTCSHESVKVKDVSQQFDFSTNNDLSPHNVPCLFDNNNLAMLIPGVSNVYSSHNWRDSASCGGVNSHCNINNSSNLDPGSSISGDNNFNNANVQVDLSNLEPLCRDNGSNYSLKNSIATQTDVATSRASSFHSLSHASHSSSLSRDLNCKPPREKLLIYTWGSETYIPHKVGIKRMKWTDFSKVPFIGEVTARRSSMLLPDVMENLHNMAGNRRDKPDVTIEMHGHIVGLSLSPDHKFLYVNCRPWPKNYIISDPQESPPLAQEVEISTIDLTTFTFVGPVLRSHKAYTHSDECFFLNLDVSDNYVASGAEDRQGYLWDRHYGIPLYRFPHRSVVNCVAINPQDPEILVTVSDDYTFKVWMSRCRASELTGTSEEVLGTSV